MSMLANVNWEKVDKAEETTLKLEEILNSFKTDFTGAFKRWSQSNRNLE
jgi:hypothetical protein